MNTETYVVQTARGAQANTAAAKWWNAQFRSSLEQAREAMAEVFREKLDCEDRGTEYEREWGRLIEQTKDANVGDVLAFDEFAVRVVVECN